MSVNKIIGTEYGFKKEGLSKFVVVAPHAAGDDLRTREVGEELAEILGASLVVNKNYRREDCDLNDLADLERNHRKKKFFGDISELVEKARAGSAKEHDGKRHALVVYIHGMKDEGNLGVDLGMGAKFHQGEYKKAKNHPLGGRNTGVVRTSRRLAREMRVKLDEELQAERGLRAWMGKKYPGWSKNNGIQYHVGTPDHSLQIEICRSLREEPRYIARKIAGALEEAYRSL